jgi:hypothetical protein
MTKTKEQVIFDINADKFRYLYREENKLKQKVDIIELNRRLNENKKVNFYSNTKILAFSLIVFGIFALITMKL